MPKTLKTFTSLQAGRAAAALMVVLYHCCVILDEPKYWHHSWRRYLSFGHSGVEFFFVLSGIVILNAHWDDQGRPAALKAYAWKRFRRIYPIYWLVLAVVLPVFQLIPSLGTGAERQPSIIFSSIFLVHIFETGTILGAAWTLYHEMMFYTVFAFLIWRRKLGLTLLGIWFVCSIYALVFPPANGVAGVYLSPLHLLFGFGMIAMVVIRSGTVPAPGRCLWLGLAIFIATCVHESLLGKATPMAIIFYGLAATLCTLGLMELERSGRLAVSPVLIFLGDASYSIYLVHQPALSVLAKIIYPISLRMRFPLILPFLLLTAGSVSLGVLVHLLIERPLLKVVRRPSKLMDLSVAT